MTDRLSQRIYDVALDELPKRSFGLEVVGIDVAWGTWVVQMPNGQQQPQRGFGIIGAIRAAGPSGEVLLGAQPPLTSAHVFGHVWPSEAEIRAGVSTLCDSLREIRALATAPQNGHLPQAGPTMPLRRPIRDDPQA
jgi:hypothetical protein